MSIRLIHFHMPNVIACRSSGLEHMFAPHWNDRYERRSAIATKMKSSRVDERKSKPTLTRTTFSICRRREREFAARWFRGRLIHIADIRRNGSEPLNYGRISSTRGEILPSSSVESAYPVSLVRFATSCTDNPPRPLKRYIKWYKADLVAGMFRYIASRC